MIENLIGKHWRFVIVLLDRFAIRISIKLFNKRFVYLALKFSRTIIIFLLLFPSMIVNLVKMLSDRFKIFMLLHLIIKSLI